MSRVEYLDDCLDLVVANIMSRGLIPHHCRSLGENLRRLIQANTLNCYVLLPDRDCEDERFEDSGCGASRNDLDVSVLFIKNLRAVKQGSCDRYHLN